jgi:hypothetical protein
VSAVFVPAVAFASATNVTMPVVGFNVKVPSPAMVTTLSESHVVVVGVYRQVLLSPLVCNCVPVASPEVPVIVVNDTEFPRNTDFVSSDATGAVGAATVGEIVAFTYWPSVSAA